MKHEFLPRDSLAAFSQCDKCGKRYTDACVLAGAIPPCKGKSIMSMKDLNELVVNIRGFMSAENWFWTTQWAMFWFVGTIITLFTLWLRYR